MFLVPFANALTPWLLPVAQGLLVAGVVDAALRTAAIALSPRALIGLFAVLAAVSSLPWFSGQLMPDIFTPVVILLSFVVVWAPVSRSRTLWPPVLLLSFAIAVHLSHFPLAAVLLLAGLAFRVATDSRVRPLRAAAPLALRTGVPLAVAVIMVVAPNYLIHRRFVLSRSSSIFALAHLVGDGSAQRYLARACATRPYALCAERDGLQPDVDWFLWSATGPRARSAGDMARGDSTLLREAPLIVAGTLRQEWPAILANSLRGTARQVARFGLHPGELTFSASVASSIDRLGPGVARAYRRSRQANDALPVVTASRVQHAAVGLALLVLLWCLPKLRGPRHRPFRLLVCTTALGLVVNAAVTASLARIHERYQSRVVWLLVALGVVALLRWREDRRQGQTLLLHPEHG